MHTVLYDRTVSSLLLRKNGFILYREKERKKKDFSHNSSVGVWYAFTSLEKSE